MLKVRKSFTVFVLLFNLAACTIGPALPIETTTPAPAASFTPRVPGTETARADASPTPCAGCTQTALAASSPTPWVAGTQTALAALSPTPSETAQAIPSATPTAIPTFAATALPEGTLPPFITFTPHPLHAELFSPVLYGSGPFLLIGGVKTDQGWLSGVQAAQYIGSGLDYDFFNPGGTVFVQGSPLEFSPTCRNHYMPASVALPEPMVGLASGWITEKRVSRELATDNPIYIQAVAEWFQTQGNSPTEIRLTRVLEADIEGDGIHEILLSASYFKETNFTFLTETGDYSVVLMRKVVGNQVVTVPLVGEYYVSTIPNIEMSYPNTYTVAEAIDLNRDGTLEVVVDVRRWEGWGAIVFRVDGLTVREVIRTIC